MKQEIKNSLLKRYKEDDFSVIEQTEILNAVSSIFSILNLVLVAIAGISLIVAKRASDLSPIEAIRYE